MARVRRWCFTLNNPQDDQQIQDIWQQWSGLSFGVCQRERGESGTLHYQGYTEWNVSMRLGSVRRLLHTAHWEPARGSADQNVVYCTKEDGRVDGPWTIGAREQEQGRRTDLQQVQTKLDGGATADEIADTHFACWVRYLPALERYERRVRIRLGIRPEQRRVDVVVICGPTRSGKTRLARDTAGETPMYWWGGDEWWPNYSGERIILLDEFRGGLPLGFFLRLIDPFPGTLPLGFKGGSTECEATLFFITSNIPPERWYDREKYGDQVKAVFARIKLYIWLDGENSYCQEQGYNPEERMEFWKK